MSNVVAWRIHIYALPPSLLFTILAHLHKIQTPPIKSTHIESPMQIRQAQLT